MTDQERNALVQRLSDALNRATAERAELRRQLEEAERRIAELETLCAAQRDGLARKQAEIFRMVEEATKEPANAQP